MRVSNTGALWANLSIIQGVLIVLNYGILLLSLVSVAYLSQISVLGHFNVTYFA